MRASPPCGGSWEAKPYTPFTTGDSYGIHCACNTFYITVSLQRDVQNGLMIGVIRTQNLPMVFRNVTCVIIDEVSVLSGDVLAKVDDRLSQLE